MAKKKKIKETLVKTKQKFKTILSFDMGVNNCAYGVLKEGKIISLGFFKNTISNLIDPYFNLDIEKFIAEFKDLLKKYQPDAVVAERFQNRGMFRGNGSELINIMIGLMSRVCQEKKIYIALITAAQWKNRYTKFFEHLAKTIVVKGKKKKFSALEVLYESLLPFPNHMIDAHLQGWYLANMWLDNPYEKWRVTQLKKFSKGWLKENTNGRKTRKLKR
jgi:hypothetical protein